MASLIYEGGAPAVAQVDSATPDDSPAEGDVYTMTLENHAGEQYAISYTAGAAPTVKTVVEGLHAAAGVAKAAVTSPWDEVTSTEDDAKVTLTADTAGVPFWLTCTATGGGSPTLTRAAVTAVAGPKIISTAENWSSNTTPANGDSLTIPAVYTGDIYGQDLSAVTLVGFTIEDGYSDDIGSLAHPLHITLKHSADYYHANLAGTGEIHLQIDDYHNINVTKAGDPPATGRFALNLTGATDNGAAGESHININCTSGESIGIGANAGEDMEANKITISGGAVTVGASVTDYNDAASLDLEMYDGDVTLKAAMDAVTVNGGTLTTEGTNAIVTLAALAGTVNCNSSGTITTLTDGGRGNVTFAGDLRSKTVTNASAYSGASLKDPNKVVTFTNGVDLQYCKIEDVTLDLGAHITITRSAV